MAEVSRGFSRYAPPTMRPAGSSFGSPAVPSSRTLQDVIRGLDGANSEMVERGKTIFFPGDPAEKVYLIRRGAVRLSRVYESGEEITVALSTRKQFVWRSVVTDRSPLRSLLSLDRFHKSGNGHGSSHISAAGHRS